MKTFIIVITSLLLSVILFLYPAQTLEIAAWIIALFFIFMYFIAFPLLSPRNILFGRYEKNMVKITKRGENFLWIYHAIEGKENKRFEPSVEELVDGNQVHSPLQQILKKMFGMFWIGNIFTDRVKYIPIEKKRATETSEKDSVSLWITEPKVEEEDNIRWRPQRAIALSNVEFADGKSAGNFLIVLELELVNPIIPVFTLRGNFYRLIEEKSIGELLARMAKFTNFADCIASNKTHANYDGLMNRASVFNIDLLESTGYIVRDFTISKRQVIDELAEATLAQENARLLGEATKTTAIAKADARRTEADAETYFITQTEEAKVKAVVSQVKASFSNATDEEQMKAVFDLLGKKAIADNKNLQVLVTDLLRK